jgi:hypothetical protein
MPYVSEFCLFAAAFVAAFAFGEAALARVRRGRRRLAAWRRRRR